MKTAVYLFLFLLTLLLNPANTRAQSKKGEYPSGPSDSCSRDIVPMRLRDDIVLAQLEINQKPMTFIVDSAGITMINADRVTLPIVKQVRTGTTTVTAMDSLEWWNVVEIKSFAIGNEEFHELKVLSRSLPHLEKQLRSEVDGILGADVLRRWDRVSLDYKRERIVLERVYCGPTDRMATLEFQRAFALQHR